MAGPALSDLEAFAAVARERSFRRAAARRGVSASTLSQAVRDLEDALGVRLLNRTTRSVSATEAGARLLQRLDPALGEIAAAVEAARGGGAQAGGLLRINAPEPAVELLLAPLIGGFLREHPAVQVEITAESRPVDIVAEGYDAGVRWDERLAQDMIAVPLAETQRYVLVAAPEVVERFGAPGTPEDLLKAPCVRQRFHSGVTPPWEFERDGRVVRVDPPARLVSTSIGLQKRAVLDGAGFWMAFEGYVAAELAEGRLRSVLADWLPGFPGPSLYFPSRRYLPSPLRAFVDYVRRAR